MRGGVRVERSSSRRGAPLDWRRIEVVDHDVAAVLRAKSGMERLRLAHEAWELARARLTAFLSARYPELDAREIQTRVAERLAGEPG